VILTQKLVEFLPRCTLATSGDITDIKRLKSCSHSTQIFPNICSGKTSLIAFVIRNRFGANYYTNLYIFQHNSFINMGELKDFCVKKINHDYDRIENSLWYLSKLFL